MALDLSIDQLSGQARVLGSAAVVGLQVLVLYLARRAYLDMVENWVRDGGERWNR